VPDEAPYNPLDIEHLGESVADALLDRFPVPFMDLAQFNGAGVYAIYYTGDIAPFPAYEPLARRHRDGRVEAPIYVGKAVPTGARKGKRTANLAGQALFKRLAVCRRERSYGVRDRGTAVEVGCPARSHV